jgi:hypothetical protein
MPYLPPEGAGDEQVVHCLWLLVTRTQWGWGCNDGVAAGRRPSTVLHGLPEEELDALRCPSSPDQFLGPEGG